MSEILMLGGAGFIGSRLINRLLKEHEAEIVVFDREQAFYDKPEFQNPRVHVEKGEWGNAEILEALFQKYQFETVFHLISTIMPGSSLENTEPDVNNNLVPTIRLLRLMNTYHVPNIVFFSSGGSIYGKNGLSLNRENDLTNPINLYGWLKLVIEKYIMLMSCHMEIKYLIIRPSNVYGPGQNINGNTGLITVNLAKIASGRQIEIWGDGSVVRDYIFVSDLCDAVVQLMNKNKWNETFNIGVGKGYSVNDILEMMRKVTKKEFQIKYTPARKSDIQVNTLDISKIQKNIGWFPQIFLEEGIRETWSWVKKVIGEDES